MLIFPLYDSFLIVILLFSCPLITVYMHVKFLDHLFDKLEKNKIQKKEEH
jgi:hypothetical protein